VGRALRPGRRIRHAGLVGIAFNLPLTWLPAMVLGLAVPKTVERRERPA
jgi:hypothetical protein